MALDPGVPDPPLTNLDPRIKDAQHRGCAKTTSAYRRCRGADSNRDRQDANNRRQYYVFLAQNLRKKNAFI